jgi:hypothetical protein
MNSADALLVQLAGADAAVRPNRPQFFFTQAGAGSQTVTHPGFPDDEIPCQKADILDLKESGYLRFHSTEGGITFDVTTEGHERAAQLDQATRAAAGGSVELHALDWTTRVLPVLQAAARAYSRTPSQLGVRTEDVVEELGSKIDQDATALALDELVRAGYLEETMGGDQLPGPGWSRLTEKGLQVTAGWPSASGEIALDRLLKVIEERIEATTGEERSKWERLRDGIADVGRGVLVAVLTESVNAAAKQVGN